MLLRYRILEEAEHELFAAAAHIEAEREGFGMKLFDELDAVIEIALEQPKIGAPIELPVPYDVRRFQLRRFSYSVFVAIMEDQLVVFAVSHHKRAPDYWARRLAKVEP